MIILLTSSNNQISEFRIPNIYYEIFVLIFLMILRTHFAECIPLLFDQASKLNIGDSEFGNLVV